VGALGSSLLVFILVMGMLASLFYSSSIMASQSKGEVYEELAWKRADMEIYRLRTPENICFELDSEILKTVDEGMIQQLGVDGSSLTTAMANVDLDAHRDQQMEEQLQMPPEYFEIMGNRYTGYGLSLDRAEAILPFLKAYEGRLDNTVERTETGGIFDDVHHYGCNFEYGGKYYYLGIKLYSLLSLNEYAGYLPITITDQMLGDGNETHATVFRLFNNTAVWQNRSDSWLTLQVTPDTKDIPPDLFDASLRPISTKIAPSKSWDLYLGGRMWLEDTTFHYKIKEYPSIQGTILVKGAPLCMDFDTARSLYSQTMFPFKAPSYVPEAYEYKCMQASTDLVSLFYSDSEFEPIFMAYGLAEGQIQIRISDGDRRYGLPEDPRSEEERIRDQYEGILRENPAINPQLVDINGNLAWANEASPTGFRGTVVFPDGSEITTTSALPARVRFYDNGVGVHLEGYLPLQELVKMAESLE
jgi:hypothetical protein